MASRSIRENFGYLMQSGVADAMGVFLRMRQGRGLVFPQRVDRLRLTRQFKPQWAN
jgi:hypothetical protein